MDRPVWIKRCRDCGTDDLDVACGVASIAAFEDRPWRCVRCGSEQWLAAGLAMPDAPDAEIAGCPFLSGVRV